MRPGLFLRDNRRTLMLVAIGAFVVVSGCREVFCDRHCQAKRAAEQYVEALANDDYDAYVASVYRGTREDFESKKECLDWEQAKLGEVYDFSESPDPKTVEIRTPSGGLALPANVRPPEGDELEGHRYLVSATPGICPLDLSEFLERRVVDE